MTANHVDRVRPGRSPGQASVEWVALLALLAAVLVALGALSAPAPLGLAHSLFRSLLCAVSLERGCPEDPGLAESYGPELAREVERLVPTIHLGRDPLGMPVDFRTCRSAACAEGTGPVRAGSLAGERPVLFTRVVDCRGSREGPPGCSGGARGNLYLQYWAYFPESATFRGVPVLARRGYHRHDWESVQLRVSPDGTVAQRASSHAGYAHLRSSLNWPSDAGLAAPTRMLERVGLREGGGWGPWTGRWFVAGGSHAGAASARQEAHPVSLRPDSVRLVPLEAVRSGGLARAARFDPVTPPWRKRVWSRPESTGTG